jgi:hypothetical protein
VLLSYVEQSAISQLPLVLVLQQLNVPDGQNGRNNARATCDRKVSEKVDRKTIGELLEPQGSHRDFFSTDGEED